MSTYAEKCEVVAENERACECCPYGDSCSRGVTGGPNGDYYPPCADCGLESILTKNLVTAMYTRIRLDELEDVAPLPWHIEEDDMDGWVCDANNTKLFGGENNEGRVSATDPVIAALVNLLNSMQEEN